MTNENPEEVFNGMDAVEGLESLGRAIVDAQGVPSGSPANYEYTRGKPDGEVLTAEDKARIIADLQTEFGINDG